MGRDLNVECHSVIAPLSKAQTAGGFLASFTSSQPTILYLFLHCKHKSPTDSKDRSPAAGCPHR
uniref:Uncharacterized protein n=1 Tax=Mandrillus leucophaeus TaxID=9568 RepID=A0A2K5Z2S5_MANLE